VSASESLSGFRRGLVLTGSGSVVSLALLFGETVAAARLLSADAFGSYILLLTTANFVVMAIDFGCKSSVTQLIAGGDRARQGATVGTVLAFRIAVVVAAGALIWLGRGLLALVDPSPLLVEYAGYLPLMVATASLDELLFSLLQGFQAYRPMAVAQIARGVLRLSLTVLLLGVFQAGVAGLVYSWSISFALAIAYQLRALPVRALGPWRWALLLETLRFGLPLQVTRVLGFGSARLRFVLLGALAGPASVAYFALASRAP
jgi:O-antigen/teichoic acid export membrane protein